MATVVSRVKTKTVIHPESSLDNEYEHESAMKNAEICLFSLQLALGGINTATTQGCPCILI